MTLAGEPHSLPQAAACLSCPNPAQIRVKTRVRSEDKHRAYS